MTRNLEPCWCCFCCGEYFGSGFDIKCRRVGNFGVWGVEKRVLENEEM